uniref:Secreted protein n=1 Tax=Astatotilapia calliptera TaxID=8154 RepID=A0AAX7VKK7_ASTCA
NTIFEAHCSMTCIMCFTWLVSHLLISSSRASSRSGPLHICVKRQGGETLAQDEETKIYIYYRRQSECRV